MKIKSNRVWRFVVISISSLFFVFMIGALFLFFTPMGTSWRLLLADTLITTQHRDWAKYLIGTKGLQQRVAKYQETFEKMGDEQDHRLVEPTINFELEQALKQEITIEKIKHATFTGYIMSVPDPKKVRIVVPNRAGKGEKVTSMVERTSAIAGVNAGGFADPEWKGNGFLPIGLVLSEGRVFFNYASPTTKQHIVGIDRDGLMIAGKYSLNELKELHVQEAVSFSPRFIVNGKGLIKNQADGWGIAPRTAMAQTEDGTILFIVIDGRQAHSIGASLYDLQKILLEKGAVIAANLDGGSSTVLVHNNEIVNSPASSYGERYLPSAWLVFEHPEQVDVTNIWEGLDPKKIDPAKW
jgi:exopolysaccharide biosynthesis protein